MIHMETLTVKDLLHFFFDYLNILIQKSYFGFSGTWTKYE
jgi:hypothetical protein